MLNKEALIESLKELGRVALIAVIPVLIDSLSQNTISWRALGIAALIAVLRATDKWVHENPSIKLNGIIPF